MEENIKRNVPIETSPNDYEKLFYGLTIGQDAVEMILKHTFGTIYSKSLDQKRMPFTLGSCTGFIKDFVALTEFKPDYGESHDKLQCNKHNWEQEKDNVFLSKIIKSRVLRNWIYAQWEN